jgi:hypothetical protein
MLVFNRKRVLFVAICLIVIFCGLRFRVNDDLKAVEVSATPVSGYCVILDAGHGQPDRWSYN